MSPAELQFSPLLIIGLALALLCACGFWLVGRTSPVFKGVNWLAAAYTCGASAALLRLLPTHFIWANIFFSNTLLLLVFVLLHCALLQVLKPGGRLPYVGVAALLLQCTIAPFLLGGPRAYAERIAFLSVLLAFTILDACWVTLRQGIPLQGQPASAGLNGSTNAMVGILTVNAVFSVVRGFLVLTPAVQSNAALFGRLQEVNLFITILSALGIAFSFLWMTAERLRRDLEVQARVDALTGLLNRRALESEFEREAERAARYNEPLSLLMLDLDHFKVTNDLHGHIAGDRMLCEVAEVMRRSLRRVDLIARVGGEEFVALLPQTTVEQAERTAERLRQEIAAHPVAFQGSMLRVTASIGVAGWQSHTWENLLRVADLGMYQAKGSGRNRVEVAAS